jgi:hypothetical protein
MPESFQERGALWLRRAKRALLKIITAMKGV